MPAALEFRAVLGSPIVAILAVGVHRELTMSPVSAAMRLATRCPSCKGTLIKRGAGRAHGASAWFYCFVCKHAWKGRAADARATADGELTGSIVVATRKERHSVRGVVVHAIPEDALTIHLERRTLQRTRQSRNLQHEIDVLTARLADARSEEDRLWNIQKQDESNLRKAKAWSVAFANTKKLTGQLENLQTRWRQLMSAEHFLEDLPASIATATTDADGRFTLAIPRDGRYGIAARACRTLADVEQSYLWFVWVSLDGQAAKRLVLNNDNVVGVGSPDSALP